MLKAKTYVSAKIKFRTAAPRSALGRCEMPMARGMQKSSYVGLVPLTEVDVSWGAAYRFWSISNVECREEEEKKKSSSMKEEEEDKKDDDDDNAASN